MVGYADLIKKLLSEDAHSIGEDAYLLTFYIDTYASSRAVVETKIKSFLKKGFLEDDVLKSENNLRNKIWDEIQQELNAVEFFRRGLAIFVKLSLKKKDVNVEIAHLYIQPETEVYVGQEYDLDQLMWIDNVTKDSFVINLQFNNASIYRLCGEEFFSVDKIQHEIEKDFKEYLQKYSPMKGGAMYHGTGEINKERQDAGFLKSFFSEVVKTVKEDHLKEGNIDYIVVFHSSSFDFVSKDIEKEIKEVIGVTPIIFSKNVEDESILKKEVDVAVHKAESSLKRERLEAAKSNREQYAEGWNEVCYTSRTGRVEELFLMVNATAEGYLGEDGFVYTNFVDNAIKIKNIVPRLVKNTLEQGGKVNIFMEGKDLLKEGVVAKLRF